MDRLKKIKESKAYQTGSILKSRADSTPQRATTPLIEQLGMLRGQAASNVSIDSQTL